MHTRKQFSRCHPGYSPPAKFASQLTGTQGPYLLTQNKVATVKCVNQAAPYQATTKQTDVKLTIDGGIIMETKKIGIFFKKLAIGLSVGTMMNMSVLP